MYPYISWPVSYALMAGSQNMWLKSVDLVLQIVTLNVVLEEGFPTTLCYVYSTLIAANCFSCVFTILSHARLTAFTEVLIDTVYVVPTASDWRSPLSSPYANTLTSLSRLPGSTCWSLWPRQSFSCSTAITTFTLIARLSAPYWSSPRQEASTATHGWPQTRRKSRSF